MMWILTLSFILQCSSSHYWWTGWLGLFKSGWNWSINQNPVTWCSTWTYGPLVTLQPVIRALFVQMNTIYYYLFLCIALLLTGEIFEFFAFIHRHPFVIWDLMTFSVASALGQVNSLLKLNLKFLNYFLKFIWKFSSLFSGWLPITEPCRAQSWRQQGNSSPSWPPSSILVTSSLAGSGWVPFLCSLVN